DLAKGETNREANLRESADASAKVKEKVKKGQSVTIHETVLDAKGKIWYALTVDDLATDGFMRDYVVDVEGELQAPTATPEASATPQPDSQTETQQEGQTSASESGVIGTGKTNREANVRKIMNGKVITTLRKNKRVSILDVRLDKNGNIWYQVQPEGSTTVGFMRDYVVTLDAGVTLPVPEGAATPAPDEQAEASGGENAGQTSTTPANDILNREVFGKAKTNRAANVRSEPKAGSTVVRQLSKGVSLHILDMYQTGEETWYEVATETGKTYGFVRDYVIDVTQIDAGLTAKTYEGG
ncbi:MAG: SH3 domain-containing protein, partial [Clostridia bacterium]|nr:SH3 domain-containing protein [Clostridia bacterium]